MPPASSLMQLATPTPMAAIAITPSPSPSTRSRHHHSPGSATTSMAKLLVIRAAPLLSPVMEPFWPSARSTTTAVATGEAARASMRGIQAPVVGINAATTSMESGTRTIQAVPSPSRTMDPSLRSGPLATMAVAMAMNQAIPASSPGMAATGCSAAVTLTAKLRMTTAVVLSPSRAMAALLPSVPNTTTTPPAKTPDKPASTPGMAQLGCNAAVTSMERLLKTSVAAQSRSQAMATHWRLARNKTAVAATSRATPASTTGMARLGSSAVTTSMAKAGAIRAASPFPSPPTATLLPSAGSSTTATAATQATPASTTGMARLGSSAVTTSMERAPATAVAARFLSLAMATSSPSEHRKTLPTARILATPASTSGMARPGITSAATSMEKQPMTTAVALSPCRAMAAPLPSAPCLTTTTDRVLGMCVSSS